MEAPIRRRQHLQSVPLPVLSNDEGAFTLILMVRKAVAVVGLILLGFSVAGAAPKPNLVLITLDSARADRMGFLGAKGGPTPNLDRLASESIDFRTRLRPSAGRGCFERNYSFRSISTEHRHERDWRNAARQHYLTFRIC